ncbi:MAG: UDP-N-acetylmuramoylalanyl-D-glutamyl-2, 6-diaminopimelate--D-alanyl-D-alanine ligase, partial [Desulfovibrio sp.]|nr:UDP-N-acetylmuramoylalanyl-D-glutamyl-2, 6-diaminopimelate--D-alanyl-D-alanine ligase [Desulfovibrio sp.]
SRPIQAPVPVFIAEDTVEALGALASRARQKTRAKVICLTGTAGKTTLKDALASIFSVSFFVMATYKNRNNQIGLPLAIMNAKGDEDVWILEAGISHEGDMDYLGKIASPDFALLLNAGAGHIEGLGKRGVAANKARLLRWLGKDGVSLVNGDYPDLLREAREYDPNLKIFSLCDASEDFRVDFADSRSAPLEGVYVIKLKDETCLVKTPYTGEWGAEISIASGATARLCGVSIDDIQKGLAKANTAEHRFRRLVIGSWIIIDDTYNANPLSMRRMIASAKDLAVEAGKPLVLILGEMGELGDKAEEAHRELGREIRKASPVAVFWKGDFADSVKSGIGESDIKFNIADDPRAFMEQWQELGLEKGAALIKGSRSNRMENFLETLASSLK